TVVMGTLTSNLHIGLNAFYMPRAQRTQILIEKYAFPSDQYAAQSHIDSLGAKFRHAFGKDFGVNSKEALVRLAPRKGEITTRTEDIIRYLETTHDKIAVVFMGAVSYYTGEVFDMAKITDAAHAAGAKVMFDTAHATNNIPMQLHKVK